MDGLLNHLGPLRSPLRIHLVAENQAGLPCQFLGEILQLRLQAVLAS